MLYALHEMQHALLAPFEALASANQAFFTQPHSIWAHTPYARSFAAANELATRLIRRYEKPAWGSPRRSSTGRPSP
jgi:poly(3-hydroxybutyrate) depolymerase